MKKIVLLMTCGLFLLMRCEKDDSTSIVGKWQWVSSSGGLSGSVHTPISTGYNQIIEFTKDYERILYKNNEIILKGDFQILKTKTNASEMDTIMYEDSSIKQLILINEDNLVLYDICFDCYTHQYKRK